MYLRSISTISVVFISLLYSTVTGTIVIVDRSVTTCTDSKGLCASVRKALKEATTDPAATVKAVLDSSGFLSGAVDVRHDSLIVSPGPRSIVKVWAVTGDSIDISWDLFPSKPGHYDAGTVRKIGEKILRHCAENGFPFAKVTADISQDHTVSATSVENLVVTYNIQKGRRFIFHSPLLKGTFATNRAVILKDVVISQGQTFDIRKVEHSRERLLRRPYIASAGIQDPLIVQTTEPGSESGGAVSGSETDSEVVVPIIIEDRSGLGIDGAVTMDRSSAGDPVFRGNLNFSLDNLFHHAETASLMYTGDRSSQRLDIAVGKPWLFGSRLSGTLESGLEIRQDEFGYLSGRCALMTELRSGWEAGLSLRGHEATVSTDSSINSWRYYGADLVLLRQPERYRAGVVSRDFYLLTGTGIARRQQLFTRSTVQFSAGLHLPITGRHAVKGGLSAYNLFTSEDVLAPSELFRTGDYVVRGYAEGEYPFRTVFATQLEYLFYFNQEGSVYIFIDGGIGYERHVALDAVSGTGLLGYGLGVRIPGRFGNVSLEWARNRSDGKGLGRLHVRFSNAFKSFSHMSIK